MRQCFTNNGLNSLNTNTVVTNNDLKFILEEILAILKNKQID
jgi:hypothetical protein